MMLKDTHYRKLERMYLSAPINKYYAPSLKISHGMAELIMPVTEKLFHSAGAVHGAVYFKALDDAAFFAVNSLVEDVFVLTVSYNVHLLRPISNGEMRALGKVISDSSRLYVAKAELFDSEGNEIGRGSGNFVRSRIQLSPDVGYK
jgi:uncharacterized protein (TIGR00369 family)